jgi:glycosyltransferase involved in cell wall biosynthesis
VWPYVVRRHDVRVRILLVSNLDSSNPTGQFLRPYNLGRGLAQLGDHVVCVGVDCGAVGFGPSWSTHAKSLGHYVGALRAASRREQFDVVYGHEARGGTAAILAGLGLPVVVDYHALPSVEWAGYARSATGANRVKYTLAAARSGAGEQLMARRADGIVAAGEELAEDLRRIHHPAVEPVVVSNGVPEALLDRERASASPYSGRGSARTAIATIPAAVGQANVRATEFVRAVALELDALDADLSVHVLGADAGPMAPKLHYEGFHDMATGDGAAWVAHADVCLLPYPDEAALAGGPRNKLLEYLAIGRTIVTTREGLRGLREVGNWPGVTVTTDDPADFARAVATAAQPGSGGLQDARPQVRERLRWEVLAGRVHAVLESVVRS